MARISFHRGGGGRSLPGRIFTSLFFLAFLAAGCVFTWLVLQHAVAVVRAQGWQPARCLITDSRVETASEADGSDEPFRFAVVYRYQWQGQRYRGDVYRPGYTGSSDAADAYELVERYPAGAEVDCRVDPGEPSRSALRRPSPWSVLLVFFPLVFVAVGGGGLYFLWRPSRGDGAAAPPRTATDNVGSGRGAGWLVLFFAVFAGFGLAFFIPFFALPAYHAWQARSWPTVPCTVESSQVGVHQGDDGSTYSVDVVFRYRVDGREYRANRYDFVTGSSSGYDSKAEIVDSLPPGTVTVCHYDPEAPYRAVVSIAWRGDWLIALVPLVFVLVGVVGMAGSLLSWWGSKRKTAAGVADWLPAAGDEAPAAAGPTVLEAKVSPIGKLVVMTGICLFWNGIVSVFVWQVWKSWRSGGGVDGCLVLFLVPFVLVGLALLVGVPYQFLALFNPRPVLDLDRQRIEVGDRVGVSWRFRGSARRIRRLRIVCEGREEATYRRGTDTRTDRESFAEIVVVETEQGSEIAAGNASLELPAATMHSFAAPHNKIVWSLKVEGVIDRWPDVGEEFPLVVYPRRIGA